MCGRFLLATPVDAIAQLFGVGQITIDWPPRYNIAPTQAVPVIRAHGYTRELALMRWGLVPHWADDPSIGSRMINARSETIDTKPAFRAAFASRRCIIPADGFYEWKKISPRAKQPMVIRARDGRPLAMAGLYDRWRPRDEREAPWLETCTVLTCAPNALLHDVHDRMPVLLDMNDVGRWLGAPDSGALKPLLAPYPDDKLEMYPVGRYINTPAHDDARCIEPFRPEEPPNADEPTLF